MRKLIMKRTCKPFFRGALHLPLCVALAFGTVAAAHSEQAPLIVLDGNSPGRTFDGLGAVSAGASSRLLIDYPEPQRSQILDYLFKPGYGAALQRLKVEVGADVNSTDGSEPSHQRTATDHDTTRGYEWWLMTEARKRNPNIILEALPWGAPHWVGNPTAKADEPSLYSPNMAQYVVDFIESARRDYGLDIAVVGVWNERKEDVGYVKSLRALLDQHHLATEIVCCDTDWSIADALPKDPELSAAVYALGSHYPRDKDGVPTTTAAARQSDKPLWSSEDQPNQGEGPIVSRDWLIGGRIMAHRYNENYLKGGWTATEIWSPVTSYYDNLAAPNSGLMYANTPWSGHYNVQSTIWVTAHTTQFAQPGWRYLDASSGALPQKGSYVTLRSPDQRNWSVVLETIGAQAAQPLSFQLKGGLAAGVVHVWETNAQHSFVHVADITPRHGVFAYRFAPDALYSLTTTVGQGKGRAQPPEDAPFPLPYADDFEHTVVGHAPKFLSDQDGAFEVQPCSGREGRCLRQVITEEPVPWAATPEPYTLMGNADWTDYSVSVDVQVPVKGAATLTGRIDSADTFVEEKAKGPSGYVLSLQADGAWQLMARVFNKPDIVLAKGVVAVQPLSWRHLELSFAGRKITAALDGQRLAETEDTTHTHGMVALGSSWDQVSFDNLRVAP
jgi:O-glycosyl hydrolase